VKIRNNYLKKIIVLAIVSILIIFILLLGNLTPGFKGSIDQELRIFFKQTNRIISWSIKDSLSSLFSSVRYKVHNEMKHEKLKINIKFKNFNTLKDARKKALATGINTSRKKVPISIEFNNKTYKATARLKGVLSDHYGNNKQFSLRVNLKKGGSIKGMKEFDLIQHYSRQFPGNIIYSKILSDFGVDTANFYTFEVNLNGDDWGLMLAEEQFSDAYFELRRKKYSPIVKFTNEADNTVYRKLIKDFPNDAKFISYLIKKQGKIENFYYNKNDFDNIYFQYSFNYIQDLKDNLINQVDKNSIQKIFDMDKFSKIFILAVVTGEFHQFGFRNIRFYFNPFTHKLEPIPSDLGSTTNKKIENDTQFKETIKNFFNCKSFCPQEEKLIYDKIFKNSLFQKKFKENIKNFAELIDSNQAYLENLCQYKIKCKDKINFELIKSNLDKLNNKINFIKIFNENNFKIKSVENLVRIEDVQKKYFKLLEHPIFLRAASNGELRLINLTPYSLKIKELIAYKTNCKKNCQKKIPLRLILKSNEFVYEKININDELKNFQKIKILLDFKDINLSTKKFDIEELNNFELKKNELFDLKDLKLVDNNFIIDREQIFINKPLIIPKNYNLIIEDGVKVNFAQNAYIELNEGHIEAIGSETKKIYFQPISSNIKWKGIFVKNAKKKSTFKNTVISDVKYFKSNIASLTGGLNFYKSDVEFYNTTFKDTSAEDFLNITESKFIIKDSKFVNSESDAIDSDFSSGKILSTTFAGVGGDAADFSGSDVMIKNSSFKDVLDKSISAGEKSILTSDNNTFINSNIAIASKDESTVSVLNNNFVNSILYDIVAFQKKNFYPNGGQINIKHDQNKKIKAKSDFASKIIINKIQIDNSNLDLEEIY